MTRVYQQFLELDLKSFKINFKIKIKSKKSMKLIAFCLLVFSVVSVKDYPYKSWRVGNPKNKKVAVKAG